MALFPWKDLLWGNKKTEEQKKWEAQLKQKQSIAKLDQQLKEIDLKAVIEIWQLNFSAV